MRIIDADALKIPNTYTDAFENCRNCKLLDQDQVREIINNAPTIDAVSEWIPCSERLPDERGQYLVTTYAYNDYYYVDVLSFHKGKFYSTDSEWGDMVDNDVVAWMPLPKPYGERKESE